MSKIIGARDTISIEIDGLSGQVRMGASRDMDGWYVCSILAKLIANLCDTAMVNQAKAKSFGILTKTSEDTREPSRE